MHLMNALVFANAVALVGCDLKSSFSSASSGEVSTIAKATKIQIVSGQNQTGYAGQQVSDCINAKLTADSGQAVQGATFFVGTEESAVSDSDGLACIKPTMPTVARNSSSLSALLKDDSGNIVASTTFTEDVKPGRPVTLALIDDFAISETHSVGVGDYAILNFLAKDEFGNYTDDPDWTNANLQVTFFQDSSCTNPSNLNVSFEGTDYNRTLTSDGYYDELYGFDTTTPGTYYLRLELDGEAYYHGGGAICSHAVTFQ